MIKLEPFSEHEYGALSQARSLKPLINRERGWLQAVQPGTVERYQSVLKGAKNITRIAKGWRDHETPVEASIIRRGNIAIGIATVIHGQQIVHPEKGVFTGNDVDYWLRLREGLEAHEEVARELLSRAGQTAMVAIVGGHPNSPQGLERFMTPVGEPGQLAAGDTEDVYDVARAGRVSQLYVFPATEA
ncbi:MAG TPA: hypothetical protein VHB72_04610 [Candidatus Saccharimonadales bacterium]|nr:hypothetical protein [Candidatus Saccharimonadales bacterium]